MSPRITNLQMTRQFLTDINSVQNRMAESQRRMSTGQRINVASDDPFGTAQAMSFDGQLRDIEQFQRNVGDAMGFMNTAESSLSSVTGALQRIRELMVQASNSTNSQSALNSIAAEITQLKSVVRDAANHKYGDDYLFSGTASSTEPYPAPTNAFAGNTQAINRRISPGLQMQINLSGPQVFGTTTGATPAQMGLFDLIDQVVADLQSGSPAQMQQLRTDDLQALDVHLNNVLQQRATLGSNTRRLETTQERLADLNLRITESRSNVVDADMAKTYMEFQTHNTMYQAALSAGSRMMQTSLLDFL